MVLPGIMGELGIYPRHAPLITQIKAGVVRIKVPGKAEEEMVYVRVSRKSGVPRPLFTSHWYKYGHNPH